MTSRYGALTYFLLYIPPRRLRGRSDHAVVPLDPGLMGDVRPYMGVDVDSVGRCGGYRTRRRRELVFMGTLRSVTSHEVSRVGRGQKFKT